MILRELLTAVAIMGVLTLLICAGVGISYIYDLAHGARICMEVQR